MSQEEIIWTIILVVIWIGIGCLVLYARKARRDSAREWEALREQAIRDLESLSGGRK